MSLLTYKAEGRKGYTLAVVLVLSSLVGMSAMALYSAANLDMMISGNVRRGVQAKIAAMSGINHFMAMGVPVSDISAGMREEGITTKVIIPKTGIGDTKTYYTVSVSNCCGLAGEGLPENTLFVKSVGVYAKAGNTIAEHHMHATVVYR